MYTQLVKIINILIKIANKIKLVRCSESSSCLCSFCSKEDCKYKAEILEIK